MYCNWIYPYHTALLTKTAMVIRMSVNDYTPYFTWMQLIISFLILALDLLIRVNEAPYVLWGIMESLIYTMLRLMDRCPKRAAQ